MAVHGSVGIIADVDIDINLNGKRVEAIAAESDLFELHAAMGFDNPVEVAIRFASLTWEGWVEIERVGAVEVEAPCVSFHVAGFDDKVDSLAVDHFNVVRDQSLHARLKDKKLGSPSHRAAARSQAVINVLLRHVLADLVSVVRLVVRSPSSRITSGGAELTLNPAESEAMVRNCFTFVFVESSTLVLSVISRQDSS